MGTQKWDPQTAVCVPRQPSNWVGCTGLPWSGKGGQWKETGIPCSKPPPQSTAEYASTSEVPRRLMVTLVVYFVVLVNVAKGLRQVEATHLELLRSYAATPFEVLRKVRVPNAVPYLFTALKIAARAADNAKPRCQRSAGAGPPANHASAVRRLPASRPKRCGPK